MKAIAKGRRKARVVKLMTGKRPKKLRVYIYISTSSFLLQIPALIPLSKTAQWNKPRVSEANTENFTVTEAVVSSVSASSLRQSHLNRKYIIIRQRLPGGNIFAQGAAHLY